MKSRVLVTDKLDESGLTILKQVSDVDYKPGIPAEELREIIKDYDALWCDLRLKLQKKFWSKQTD